MPVVLRLRPALQLNPFSPWVWVTLELPSSFPSPLPVTPSMTHAFHTSVLSSCAPFCPSGRRRQRRKSPLSCPPAPGGKSSAARPRPA
ncbi:hypothetical protein PHMEG_00023809 [Phytophthora megakarya]|uniref:Uncharacterized protein n=1 Tax=Phytophthora megakarya TaxID=4795 RepID=A0A225VHP5_9STRA|nr:hypothetical protein PHMEG_00023809 [Phytophthora megakarya]